jgi:nitroreductase
MRPDPPVTGQEIRKIMEAATWAPNHHHTEPWRFVVIEGNEKAELGEAMAAALRATQSEVSPQQLDSERSKPLAASAVVALVSSPSKGPNVVPQEEIVAAGAALQNLLLAAQSLGLASMVRTGRHAYSQPMRDYLKLRDEEVLVGLVYLGRPAQAIPQGNRVPVDGKVEWRGGSAVRQETPD